ncbi:MAG: hypothetical protein KAS90_00675 [Candidatus Aenigmarchaeota archaeon]|nr:hypothetical protein [Candidatus Aenigmarchaeota archaeon]
MVFSFFKKLKKDVNKKTPKMSIDSINPITRAMDKNLENLQNLKGKKVTIEVKSLYDQVSNLLVIKEYISGKVVYVDTYGIMLDNAVRKKYVNNKYQGGLHTPSKKCLVYHKIINYIYTDDEVPVFKQDIKKE